MKRQIVLFISILTIVVFCDKEAKQADDNTVIGSRYAKYSASVKKEQELKNWLATLEKAEQVKLIKEFDYTNADKEVIPLAKIQLADDQIGYIELRHLANDPVVFTDDTPAYSRPILASKVITTIPKGTIGFIMEKKEGWSQIYVGKIDEIWVTKQWVESSSYAFDTGLVIAARDLEAAQELIKEKKSDEAREMLQSIIDGGTFLAESAQVSLDEMGDAGSAVQAGENHGE